MRIEASTQVYQGYKKSTDLSASTTFQQVLEMRTQDRYVPSINSQSPQTESCVYGGMPACNATQAKLKQLAEINKQADYDDADNPDKIIFSGLTTGMEYRRSTDTNWTDVPASGLVYDPQKTSVVYYVQKKAITDTWASAYRSVTMVAMPSAPNLSYNQSTETLTNLRNTYEISFDGGAYTGLTSSTYNLSEKIDNIPPNGTLLVSVRSKATSTAPAGQVATITIHAR